MSVPSVQLDLGDIDSAEPVQTEIENNLESETIVAKAIGPDVLQEKCVVSQYRTSSEQITTFKKLLEECDPNYIPLEWVIDIADESNGWFYGTAYHYNQSTNMLHVMVPDKLSPSFDGEIPLDHRTVHLVECVDGKTEALFNKIVRDSVTKVRWEVEWFEEGQGTEKQMEDVDGGPEGRWVLSIARYYIQMANQLLVEDEDFGQDARGFVMLTADLNVRLRVCFKGKGLSDFERLISENIVQSTPNAIEVSRKAALALSANQGEMAFERRQNSGGSSGPSSGPSSTVRKLAEMSRGLRECLSDILDDRERLIVEHEKMSRAFTSFALDGDLDAGMRLLSHSEMAAPKDDRGMPRSKKALEREAQQELMDSAADDVWYLCQRVEKGAVKLLKTQSDVPGGVDELEYLRRTKAKMQQEIEEKDKELEFLRSKVH